MSSNTPVALITGAARRIGAAIAEAAHAAGYTVAIHFRSSADEAHALAGRLNQKRPGSAGLFQNGLETRAHCDGLIAMVTARYGRLDLLVNNASSFFPSPVGTVDEADWDALVGCNLKAPFFLIQAAAPALRESVGSAVNLADIHGEKPLKGHPVYSVAKAGVIMLTKALARELGPEVRVNAVAPGSILWPEGEPLAEAARREILQRTALKRQGTPQDIAEAVLYLAKASYVTGQVLVVDGGRSLNL